MINLDSGKSGFYCEEDAAKLQAFADLAASAIANANLYEALQEKAAEATALFKAATGLLSAGGDVSLWPNKSPRQSIRISQLPMSLYC